MREQQLFACSLENTNSGNLLVVILAQAGIHVGILVIRANVAKAYVSGFRPSPERRCWDSRMLPP